MGNFKISADPKNEVGLSIGSGGNNYFIGFDAVHDIANGLSSKQRFLINLDAEDMLWMIEALAKELPEVLHEEAIIRIEELTLTGRPE